MTAVQRPASAPDAPTAAVQDAVRDAAARGGALRIVGAGTWLDAGRPVRADATPLRLADVSGIVEYTPGDLTLTARAGTPLSEIARVTGAERQWLALDPFGADGTLGATVATASAGPLAQLFGTPRDNVLGLEFVTGSGLVARGGGRVVKNVAGFDLTRLLIGSWGTLGVVTEVTVRLRARPEAEETLALALPDGPALDAWLERVRLAPLAAWALELVSAPLARALGVGVEALLLVRVGGNADAVRAQREQLAELGDTRVLSADVWERLRRCEPPGAAVLRLSRLPSRTAETWRDALALVADLDGALVHATLGRGVVRGIVPAPDAAALGHALRASRFDGTRIAERLPAALWPALGPGPATDRLSRGIRSAYDPHHVLNPGILGESPE